MLRKLTLALSIGFLPGRAVAYKAALGLALVLSTAALFPATCGANDEDTFDRATVLDQASAFLGDGAEGIGKIIEKLFDDLGEPNAYIKGTEASGALVIGARYGNGTLVTAAGASREVHWTGPSIGFDTGGNVSKVFVLVYGLSKTDSLFQRFPAVDGSLYVVGGISANYHQSGDIILAPIRLGAGLRAGINIGYMKYTPSKTWNPF